MSSRISSLMILAACVVVPACGSGQPGAPAAPAVAPAPVAPAPAAAEPVAAEPAPRPPTPLADAYRDVAATIIEAALADERAWPRLEHLTDRIGHRLSGSKSLEQAVAWAAETMRADGHDSVRTQKVMVPHWVRGEESAEILAPVARPLRILGLGGTVGTGRRGVSGELLVVESWEELARHGEAGAVKGKIVLFNVPLPPYDREKGSRYGDVVGYRVAGPARAAALGARAALVRSVTARSLQTPHTGALRYADDAPKIPAAAVTIEDAELLARLAASGEPVTVRLTLGARTLPDAESHNVIAELRGRERPEEIVVIGAHIDSWDVGQGAHDDGGSCVAMMQALTLLRELELRPRRTIRVVLFTNEENGLRGARAYAEEHAGEIPHHVMAMEADSGTFAPRGFQLQGDDEALRQLADLVTLLEPLGATEAAHGYAGADLGPLIEQGVPALGLWVEGSRYFDYHHTEADTLDKIDPADLARNIAAVAVMAYVIADMPTRFGQ